MTDVPLEEDPRPDGLRVAKSLVLVNTGDGKGKSSAAFGVAMRARARDWPVAVVQFLKSDDWVTGEQIMAERIGVDFWSLGDGFTWDSDDLTKDEAEGFKTAEVLRAEGERSPSSPPRSSRRARVWTR